MTEQNSFNPVYVIGDTLLADYLSAKLSLAGENIYRLGTHTNETTLTYTLKEQEKGQKHSVCLPTGSVMHHQAKMTILCLDNNTLKADLAYFSTVKAGTAPIISFCHADSTFLGKMVRCPIISAYFSGWLQKEQETVVFSGAPYGMTLSISEQHPLFEDIRQVVAKTDVELHFCENNQQNFWHYFVPEIISALFMLQSRTPFKYIAKKQDLRKMLGELVKEISVLIPPNVIYDTNDLISYIYGLPDNYKPPLIDDLAHKRKGELSFVLSVLQKQAAFNTISCPKISEILRENSRKLLSSVEE